MSAPGFADRDAALVAVRRARLRLKMRVAATSIARVLEHLDVVAQPDGGSASALDDQRLDLGVGRREGDIGKIGIVDRDGQRVRQSELLEGMDAVVEFLDIAALEVGHGLFSVMGSHASAASDDAGQSLCDTPKYGDAA